MAINKTTVTVGLDATPSEIPTAEKFSVTVGGETVEVTGVTEGTANNTYVLAVNLDGKEGEVKVNGTKAADAVDFVAPSIVETVAQSATVFDVKYSEKVTKATAENVGNYTLRYAVGQATTYTLDSAAAAPSQVQATAVLLEDGQTVRVTIVDVDAGDTAFDNGGLIADANYQVKVSTNVKDLADNSAVTTYGPTFKGTNIADSTPAKVLSGNYNSTTGNLSFTFDRAVLQADVDLTKVTLTAPGKDAVSLAGLSPIVSGNELTVNASTLANSISALGNNIKVEYAAGAFEDVNGNTLPAGSKVLTVTEGLKISSSAYNEESNVLTLNFTDQVDISKLQDDLSTILVAGKPLPNAGVNLINTSNSNVVKLQLPAEYTATTGAVVKTLEDAARTNVSKADGVVVEVPDSIFTAVGATAGMTTAAGKTTLKNIEYTRDVTAPAVTSVQIENLAAATGIVTVKFDEKVLVSSIKPADLGFYDAKDAKDAALATQLTDLTGVTAVGVTAPGSTNTATYSDTVKFDLSSGGTTAAGLLNTAINTDKKDVVMANKAKAFVDVNAVEAVAGKISVGTVGLNAGATEIKTITTAAVGTKVITIKVNETGGAAIPLDKVSAEAKANYSIVPTNGGAAVPVEKTVLSADAQTITLYLAEATTTGKGYTVTAENVKNQTGSLLVDKVGSNDTKGKFVTTFTGAASTADANVTPTITTTDVDNDGKFTAGDKITLDFKQPVSLKAGAKASDFVLAANAQGNTPNLGSTASVKAEGNKVVITLGANADLKANNQISLAKATSDIINYDGTKIGFVPTVIVKPVVDAPVIKGAVYSDANDDGVLNAGDEVKVTFTSKVADDAVDPLDDDFVFGATTATYTVALAEDGMSAVLTFVDPKNFIPGTTTITVNASAGDVNLVGG